MIENHPWVRLGTSQHTGEPANAQLRCLKKNKDSGFTLQSRAYLIKLSLVFSSERKKYIENVIEKVQKLVLSSS